MVTQEKSKLLPSNSIESGTSDVIIIETPSFDIKCIYLTLALPTLCCIIIYQDANVSDREMASRDGSTDLVISVLNIPLLIFICMVANTSHYCTINFINQTNAFTIIVLLIVSTSRLNAASLDVS